MLPNDIPIGLCQCGCGKPTRIAKSNDASRGDVKGQPVRFLKGHNFRREGPAFIVDPDTGCHIWQGKKTRGGYGRIYVDGKWRIAHVWHYEQKYGPVPKGLQLDHVKAKCQRRDCCNADHVEPVTPRENTRRGKLAKLTAEQVAVIRTLHGVTPATKVGAMYGVTQTAILSIWNGKTWLDRPTGRKA